MSAPIACTLPVPLPAEHLALIAAVAKQGMLAHRQCGRTLFLLYAGKVADELEALVKLERDRCGVLDFELERRDEFVHLMITAPASAMELAATVTPYFIGTSPTQVGCAPGCCCSPKARA